MPQNLVLGDREKHSAEPSGRSAGGRGGFIAAESLTGVSRIGGGCGTEVLRHGAVVLREAISTTPEQHLAFTGRLAQVDHNPKRPAGKVHAPTVDGFPEIVVVSNIKKDGYPIGLTDAGLLWHTDTQSSSATPEPVQ